MLIKKVKEPSEQPGQPLPPPPPPPPVQSQAYDRKPSLPSGPELRVAKPILPAPPPVVTRPQAVEPGMPLPPPPPAMAGPQAAAQGQPLMPQPPLTTQPQAAAPGQPLMPQPPFMMQPQAAAQGQPLMPQPPLMTQPQAAAQGQPLMPQAPAITQSQALVTDQPMVPLQPLMAPNEVPQVAERKIREYRYRTRILKAAILPIFFAIMSFWMLYNYVNGFEPFFSYEMNYILAGFLIGFIAIAGFALANMMKAKRDGSYLTRQKYGIVTMLAFLVPYVYLILFIDPARAWRFSIGYLASVIITPFIVMAYEALSDGKFYIQEEEVNDRLTRTLVFRH